MTGFPIVPSGPPSTRPFMPGNRPTAETVGDRDQNVKTFLEPPRNQKVAGLGPARDHDTPAKTVTGIASAPVTQLPALTALCVYSSNKYSY